MVLIAERAMVQARGASDGPDSGASHNPARGASQGNSLPQPDLAFQQTQPDKYLPPVTLSTVSRQTPRDNVC